MIRDCLPIIVSVIYYVGDLFLHLHAIVYLLQIVHWETIPMPCQGYSLMIPPAGPHAKVPIAYGRLFVTAFKMSHNLLQ